MKIVTKYKILRKKKTILSEICYFKQNYVFYAKIHKVLFYAKYAILTKLLFLAYYKILRKKTLFSAKYFTLSNLNSFKKIIYDILSYLMQNSLQN